MLDKQLGATDAQRDWAPIDSAPTAAGDYTWGLRSGSINCRQATSSRAAGGGTTRHEYIGNRELHDLITLIARLDAQPDAAAIGA